MCGGQPPWGKEWWVKNENGGLKFFVPRTSWWPRWLNWFVPGYREYGGPSRSGPGKPKDLMDSAFKKHDSGYKRGDLNRADFQLLHDLDKLPSNPSDWGPGVNPLYATLYKRDAYTIFGLRQIISNDD